MAAGDTKIAYAASSNLTITLASLATDSNLLTGRQSTAVDNSSNLYVDYLLSGKISVGTTPTANKVIEVWVVAELDDSTWPDTFGASDAAVTITTQVKGSLTRLAASIDVTATTSNVAFYFTGVSVASLFGGVCPRKFVVFVTHNTAVNFNSTAGNHQITVKPVYYNTAQS